MEAPGHEGYEVSIATDVHILILYEAMRYVAHWAASTSRGSDHLQLYLWEPQEPPIRPPLELLF